MKKFFKILIIIVVIVVGLGILKNALIKTTITMVGSSILGAPIKIKSFNLGILSQKVHIKGMSIGNPEGFPAGNMIDIPEIRADFDIGAFLGGKLHLPLIIFNLKEVVLVKNNDGKLNVDSLKIAQASQESNEKKPAEEKTKAKSEMMPMLIDEMKLNIERVASIDYSVGEKPEVLAYELGLKDKVFKDIKSPQEMAMVILLTGMGPTAIKGAAIYGAATVLGVAFLPAGVIGVLVGNDSSVAEYSAGYDKVYDTSLNMLKEIGEMKSEDRAAGVIKANVYASDVAVKIEKTEKQQIKVTISARKLMLPKPDIAAGIQYQISKQL